MRHESIRRLSIICECGCGLPARLTQELREMGGYRGHYDHALGLTPYPGRYHDPVPHAAREYLALCGDSKRTALAYILQHRGEAHTEPYVPARVEAWLTEHDTADHVTTEKILAEVRAATAPTSAREFVA